MARLAMQLGSTIEELGERMSSEEFSVWCALWTEEPWGEYRADLRSAIVARTVAGFAGKTLPAGVELELADFMPFAERPDDKELSPEELFKAMSRGG